MDRHQLPSPPVTGNSATSDQEGFDHPEILYEYPPSYTNTRLFRDSQDRVDTQLSFTSACDFDPFFSGIDSSIGAGVSSDPLSWDLRTLLCYPTHSSYTDVVEELSANERGDAGKTAIAKTSVSTPITSTSAAENMAFRALPPPTAAYYIHDASSGGEEPEDWSQPICYTNEAPCKTESQPVLPDVHIKSHSLPTTPAVTPSRELSAFDSEVGALEVPQSERENTFMCPSLSSVSAIAHHDISQLSNSDGQDFPDAEPATLRRERSAFPILGFSAAQDSRNKPSFEKLSLPSQACSGELSSFNSTLSAKSSPTRSDTSSSTWTEDMQDSMIVRLVSISCDVLVRVYMRLVVNTRPSNSKEKQGKGSKKTQHSLENQRHTQGLCGSRKRKMNRSNYDSDDGDDTTGFKRRRYDPNDPIEVKDPPLACPFNKFDNILFGPDSPDESYHACATCSFVNIAHLK